MAPINLPLAELLRAFDAAHPHLDRTEPGSEPLHDPIAIAWWITAFEPALAQREFLHIVVHAEPAGIFPPDRGRWFQALPWLLGNESLRVRVSFWHDPDRDGEDDSPLNPVAHWSDAPERLYRSGWPPARYIRATVSQLAAMPSDSVSLIVMDDPRFRERHEFWCMPEGRMPEERWDKPAGLPRIATLMQLGVPVAAFSSSQVAYHLDRLTLSAYRMHEPKLARVNPSHVGDGLPRTLGRSRMGRLATALTAMTFPPGMTNSLLSWTTDHDLLDDVERVTGLGIGEAATHALGMPLLPHEVPLKVKMLPGCLLRIPGELAVSTATGDLFELRLGVAVPALGAERVPHETLARYPGPTCPARRAMWAAAVYDELLELYPYEQESESEDVSSSQRARLSDRSASAVEGSEPVESSMASLFMNDMIAMGSAHCASKMVGTFPPEDTCVDEDGTPAVVNAVIHNQAMLLNDMIFLGVNLEAEAANGWRAIHEAARHPGVTLLETLLEADVDPNALTPSGHTPLQLAVLWRRQANATVLLYYGADPEAAVQGLSIEEAARAAGISLAVPEVLD